MTVKELKLELEKLNEDLKVLVYNADNDEDFELTTVELFDDEEDLVYIIIQS